MTPAEVLEQVAVLRGVSVQAIQARSRTRYVARTRAEAAYRLVGLGLSQDEAGAVLGGRTRWTIMHLVRAHERRLASQFELGDG